MRVVILCGGKGQRIRREDEALPKVLYEIGERPILWHILKGFRSCGLDDFVLCLGHRADGVFTHFTSRTTSPVHESTSPLGDREIRVHDAAEDWKLTMVDTGESTNTGGRVRRVEHLLDDDAFLLTYGDGVSSLDTRKLIDFHHSHGRLATITAVRPTSPFGLMSIGTDGAVKLFREKPRMNSWINGGFMVFNRETLGYLSLDCVLEQEPLRRLAADGQLVAYRYPGFWACMDTYKDLVTLNDLWNRGSAEWRTWE